MNRKPPKREETAASSPEVRSALDSLLNEPPAAQYGRAMKMLGKYLGLAVRAQLSGDKPFALVSTPEDADFLVDGMLATLPGGRARLVCYWTRRKGFGGGDLATVVQQYVDPRLTRNVDVDTVVIAKAIISSGCIVRTHIEKFLTAAQPRLVIIAAPVMVKGADALVRSAFPNSISKNFEFVTFAKDPAAGPDGIVRPGISGMVEERLGLRDKPSRFSPALIESWREKYAVATTL